MNNVIEGRFQYDKVPTVQDLLREEIFICNMVEFDGPVKITLDCDENKTRYFYKAVMKGDKYKLVYDSN